MARNSYSKSRSRNSELNRRSTNRNNSHSRTRSYSDNMTRLAYQMGCVQRGLKNPDSKISDSYNAGLQKNEKKTKTLY